MAELNSIKWNDRPKRMRGNPGIWATQYKAGWTVFWVGGILQEGLSTAEAREILDTYQLRRSYDSNNSR